MTTISRLQEMTLVEAARYLEVSHTTVANAAKKGVLTPMPFSRPRSTYVSMEQVELFREKELSMRALNRQERQRWLEVKEQIEAGRGVPQGFPFPEGQGANAETWALAAWLAWRVTSVITFKDMSPEDRRAFNISFIKQAIQHRAEAERIAEQIEADADQAREILLRFAGAP